VNAVCPAVIETDINAAVRDDKQGHDFLLSKHPIGRFGKPEEIASVVLFLCSPGRPLPLGSRCP
jgi:NAD(P)-dependent dehydrogenase (short-subunit alcohol dehydrogenase family)